MPISVTGNKSRLVPAHDHGFSLVELLAVLAILSLMVGAVVLNLPTPRTETDRVTESMAAQLNGFLRDGAVAGEMRALGADADTLVLYRHNGIVWQRSAELPWPDDAHVKLEQNGQRIELPDTAQPSLLFEPYGAVPDFTLTFSARDARYGLGADDRGRIIRTVEP